MITWNNLDTLESYKELSNVRTSESCRSDDRRERCRACKELQRTDGSRTCI